MRGKWACAHCQKLVQAPVAHVIDKGVPTAGLLAHLLVAKFLDHLPLYRQECIFERAGLVIARSTLAQWVPDGSATAKAIDYSLKRWQALMHYIDDGDMPISNNWVENQTRPIALGRAN